MKPLWLFFGGKNRLAKYLGPPQHDLVIEPFCGSAGYSTYWEPRKVLLNDIDPVVCGIWDYLIKVSEKELLKLPTNISALDELPPRTPEPAKHLIGMWFNRSVATPAIRRANWARHARYSAFYWSETIKHRIASQLSLIRHWKITCGSYENISNATGHWHIDAPYNNDAGKSYRHNKIDYASLAIWTKTRKGFVQVTESSDSAWLPFEPYTILGTHRAKQFSAEAVWQSES